MKLMSHPASEFQRLSEGGGELSTKDSTFPAPLSMLIQGTKTQVNLTLDIVHLQLELKSDPAL